MVRDLGVKFLHLCTDFILEDKVRAGRALGCVGVPEFLLSSPAPFFSIYVFGEFACGGIGVAALTASFGRFGWRWDGAHARVDGVWDCGEDGSAVGRLCGGDLGRLLLLLMCSGLGRGEELEHVLWRWELEGGVGEVLEEGDVVVEGDGGIAEDMAALTEDLD